MNAIFFALISYVGWGSGDIFGAIAARKIGGYKTTFWIMLAAAILFSPLTIIYWNSLISTPLSIIILATFIGFFYQSGNFAVNEALRRTDASIALTVMGSFGAFIVLFSTVFLRESLPLFHAGIIILIFIGVFLCTYQPKSSIKTLDMKGVWFALYAAISFGIFFTAVKVFSSTLSWFWPIYLSFLWIPFIYLYLRKIHIKPALSDIKSAFIPLLFNLLLLRGADFTFNIGLQLGLASVVAPIASASPTLSVILAFIIFHEKPTRRQLFGIALALIGIVLLGFAGS
ncbi:MAG: DMT family transporter [Patescibacteria group bacterium]